MSSETILRQCTQCGEWKPIGNYFRNGDLCGSCWRKETPDWYQQLARDGYQSSLNEKMKALRKIDSSIREKQSLAIKRWNVTHKENLNASAARRRARKLGLPCTASTDDRRVAFEYWHGYCAVCGNPLADLFGDVKPHLDHWIPLSDPRPDNPGTVPENLIPLCSLCNLSKSNRDPIEWLTVKYGSRKGKTIGVRIERYFELVKK